TPNPDIMNGGFLNGITNGCDWYAIFGGRQDWMYHWYGGRETTIELSNTKNPAGSTLPQRWENNRESLLAYIEESLKGIRGIITDAQTDHQIRARIDVQSIPNSPVFSDSMIGDYHRFILSGAYNLIISAPGYYSDTVQNVVVTDTAVTYVNIALQKNTVFIPNELSEQPQKFSLLQNYPNPFNPKTSIGFSLLAMGNVSLKIYNIVGQEIATLLNNKKMEAGEHKMEFDASKLPSGVYLYRLTAGDYSETKKMIITK
ncbi:MAG: T9SS type A sorting domain-containing protein, partial [Bacteroidota bacterium]